MPSKKSGTPGKGGGGKDESEVKSSKRGKMQLSILESAGYELSKKNSKKKKSEYRTILRNSVAVENADSTVVGFSKKYAPVALFDSDNQIVKVDNLKVRMNVVGKLHSGGEASVSLDASKPMQSMYFFKYLTFSVPGEYTVTYSAANASELGYHVTPLSINVRVSFPGQEESASIEASSTQKKSKPCSPRTPSSATNARRASCNSVDTESHEVGSVRSAKSDHCKQGQVTSPTAGRAKGRPRKMSEPDTIKSTSNTPVNSNFGSKRKRSHSLPDENDGKCSEAEDAIAILNRNSILKSLLSNDEGSPVAGLGGLLPPSLLTALLDDIHDIRVRQAHQERYTEQCVAKKLKKTTPEESKRNLKPPDVFISAKSPSDGRKWSVHDILHEEQFNEFMLSGTSVYKRKKGLDELSYNVNTLLVAFENLCMSSPFKGTGLSSPLLYSEEKVCLASMGLLASIERSSHDFFYNHCNGRHLLRALTLILLASPEQTSQGKENEGINPVTKGFYDFIGRVVDYLDQNSFPYLYQN